MVGYRIKSPGEHLGRRVTTLGTRRISTERRVNDLHWETSLGDIAKDDNEDNRSFCDLIDPHTYLCWWLLNGPEGGWRSRFLPNLPMMRRRSIYVPAKAERFWSHFHERPAWKLACSIRTLPFELQQNTRSCRRKELDHILDYDESVCQLTHAVAN